MASKKPTNSTASAPTTIQFTLAGFTCFCTALVAIALTLAFVFNRFVLPPPTVNRAANSQTVAGVTYKSGPWGELMLQEIHLERPREYIEFETKTNTPVTWNLGTTPPEQARALLVNSGFTPQQIEQALSPRCLQVTPARTTILPDDDLVLSLTPPVRSRLYAELALLPDNPHQSIPFICPAETANDLIVEADLDARAAAAFRKLLYAAKDFQCFSDQLVMLRLIPTPGQRSKFMQFVLRQNALLVRIKIGPDSDVDKILGYWTAAANGVRFLDTRPLLESLKRNAEGGSASLLYLLPHFARERMNTFPLLTMNGSAKMNCHWSTFNFFNEPPDDRFADMDYLNQNLVKNYYQIATPSNYGDVILLLDGKNNLIHSAVQIADDIVFTKNGAAYEQPWVMMHLKDVMHLYVLTPGLHVSVWRNKAT